MQLRRMKKPDSEDKKWVLNLDLKDDVEDKKPLEKTKSQ